LWCLREYIESVVIFYVVYDIMKQIMSSSESPAGPDSTSTGRSLKCEQCGGIAFNTTQELAEHNRKEHGMA
jgi:hypothetical protein